jgi:hypothetical protein
MSKRPLDTAQAAWTRYEDVIDEMGGPSRLHAAVELSEAVHEVRLAGIRSRHPELSREEAVAQLVAEDHGVELPHRK